MLLILRDGPGNGPSVGNAGRDRHHRGDRPHILGGHSCNSSDDRRISPRGSLGQEGIHHMAMSEDQPRRSDTTLRPCPFCGSTKVSVSTCRRGNTQERYVECEACEAMAGSWPIGEASFDRASELAVRKWNRRSGL